MVKQYPDTLIIPGQSGDSYKDEDGNFKTQPSSADVKQDCRYEPSNGTKLVELPDGRKVAYSGIVQLPLSTPNVLAGVKIKVETKIEAEVIYFFRGQLHCKIYI